MNCPKCGQASHVIDRTRYTDGIKRRRECKSCGHRYNTAEVIYGKPFATCRGQRLKLIEGQWVTAKTKREMELKQFRVKRGKMTQEQRLEFIKRSLFPDKFKGVPFGAAPQPAEADETGEDDNG